MSKDLEYFKDFLANPASYKLAEFTPMLVEWSKYLSIHINKINYANGEEWREIRERLDVAIEIKNQMTAEYKQLSGEMKTFGELGNYEYKIVLYERWLIFFKKYQADYYVPDEIITLMENNLKILVDTIFEKDVEKESQQESTARKQKSLKELDDALFEHFERTGKRPVLTALPVKKSNKGN